MVSEWSGFHKRGLVSHSDIQSYIERIEQRLAEADSRIKELEQLNKRLAKFFQYGISCAFNGFDYDGESIHDDALALGLIVETDPPEGEEDGPWYKIATGVSDG